MNLKVPEYINNIEPYEPGKPIEELERELGIHDSVKLASNENPLGPSPLALQALSDAIPKLHRYPDGAGYKLLRRLAAHLNVPAGQIVLGNGSDEIMAMLGRVLLQAGDEVIIPAPSFLMYAIVTRSAGAVPVSVPLKNLAIDLEAVLEKVGPRTRMIFICNPNNPTGSMVTRGDLEAFLRDLPKDVLVVVDEAYIDFVRDRQCADGLRHLDNTPPVAVLRTFSKAYGLAGLRIGYGVMPAYLAELLNRVRMPFNVNTLAQVAATAALDDTRFLTQTIEMIHKGLDELYAGLEQRNLSYFTTQTNFFLIDVARPADAVFQAMLQQGVIVRAMTAYGYPQYIRVNVGLPEENQRLLSALDTVLQTRTGT